jgi:hypothetical protein
MRNIIPLALAAVFASAACISARSAVAVIDPKGAAEFVLKTCLPAMDDLTNIETMAQEGNWFRLPYIPSSSKLVESRSRWMADGFYVATWSWIDGNLPSCSVKLPNKVDRDGFLDAISASVELKVIYDKPLHLTATNNATGSTSPLRMRQEAYEIMGGRFAKRVRLLFLSADDTVSSAVMSAISE